jgi:lipopolysaccharide transport system ATP-binding protein
MPDTVIYVENLGKRYLLKHQRPERYVALRDVIAKGAKSLLRQLNPFSPRPFHPAAPNYEEFWALKEVSFEVKQGDRVGIIGRNGAGKSTLLKILSRITEPTTGRIAIRGRVASLLEVGTGFHSELTGRENIFLNGAILGMTKAEIKRKFDEIVAFAEVEKFLDTPVKHYSSGMYVRLAFAVAAHLEPEILVVDEVLAVGDAQFQKKCLGKMEDVAKNEGRTVLFVSHNMGTITQLCTKGLYLSQGKLVGLGDINAVVLQYLTSDAENTAYKQLYSSEQIKQLNKIVFFREVAIANHEGEHSSEVDVRYPFYINLSYEVRKTVKNVELTIHILTSDGRPVFTTLQSDCDPDSFGIRYPGCYQASVQVPGMFLMPGSYLLKLAAHEPMVQMYDYHENTIMFRVNETGTKLAKYQRHDHIGVVMIDLPWKIK